MYSLLDDKSLDAFEKAIKISPKRVEGLGIKGNFLNQVGRYEEAIKCYDEIITKLDPKAVDAFNNKGWALNKLGRYPEAIKCYDKALELDSNNKYVLNSKGYALINLDRYEEAIDYFNKALSIDPEYVDAIDHRKIAEEKLQNRNK